VSRFRSYQIVVASLLIFSLLFVDWSNFPPSVEMKKADAAQITIEADITDATDEYGPSPTVVFTTDQVGYIFFIDATNDLAYRKTTNGGTNWAAPQVIDSTLTGWTIVSVWYDQWTPGDTSGTKIHIAAIDDVTGNAYYTFLDTSSDTLKGSVVSVIDQTTYTESAGGVPSITRGAGGALFLSANFNTTAGGYISKSTDGAGDTWGDVTPASWSSVAIDQIQLLPLVTDNDIIAIKAQTADNTIRSRIYDEAGDTWDGSWSASIASLTENATYDQWFAGAVRKSTGDVYLTFNNNTNNASNDMEFWTFTDSGRSWTQGTNIRTNSPQVLAPVPMVDEITGNVYVAYIGGDTDFPLNGSGVNNVAYVYYQYSTDGGTSWSGAHGVVTDEIGDDYKSLSGNMNSPSRLFVAFYDDDDEDIHGTSIWSSNVQVEANIDTAIIDATDEYGPSPSGVFIDEDIGYQFYVRADWIMLDGTDEYAPSPSTVFTSSLVGYTFFIDAASQDLVYRKTADGGINWTGSIVIDTATAGWTAVSVWYDQWTPGDTTGTKIHIAASDDASDDVFYTFLDTSNDSLKGSFVTVLSGTAITEAIDGPPSVTRGAGGALFLSANFTTTAGGLVSKSTDGAGDTWSNVTPAGWSTLAVDQVQLLPLDTDDDIIAIRADTANNEMDYRVYDEVGDTWDGSWTSIGAMVDNGTYDQWFSATLDKANGDIFLTFTNNLSVSTGDIDFWTYTDSGRTWTKNTDVVTNSASVLAPVPFFEPDTGYLYVAYATGTLATTMQVVYKQSTDGGTSWGSQTQLSTTGDDFKTLRGNMMSDDNLHIIWHNDDTNVLRGDNILSIASYDLPVKGTQNIFVQKTVDGGKQWGPPKDIASTVGATAVAVWYDQWTPGDTTGDIIHIVFSEDQTDDYYYQQFDTTNDRPTPPVPVLLGTAINESAVGTPSITKGAGGDLFITGNFVTTAGGLVYKSTDGGDTWSDVTPGSWSSSANDQIQLLPLTTDNDIIAIKAQVSDNTIRSRIYDESGDSWAGSWSASIAALTDNTTYDQWYSATGDKTTGDVFLTFANNSANAANDIEFWTFTDSGRTWTQGANVITNSATTIMPVPFLNVVNGDLYVAYLRGTLAATMNVYYKKTMDGGTTWSGESSPLNPGIFDDLMALRGAYSGEKLYAFWYNDDLNDIYGNVVDDQWSLEQAAYRWFENSDGTNVGSARAALNTDAELASSTDLFRLRVLLHSVGSMPVNGSSLKLQYAVKSGTCDTAFSGETYADVTALTPIAFYDNSTPTNGATLTANGSDPTNGSFTIVNQTYVEQNNFTATATIPAGQDGKWDFSLSDSAAPDLTSYCLRVVESDGTLLDRYTVIPEIRTGEDIVQSLTFSISDASVGFGGLLSGGTRYATGDGAGGGSDSTDAHTLSVSTNAGSGYVMSLSGSTLTCVACGNTTISAIGAVATGPSTGTNQFGIRMIANSGNGTVSSPYQSGDWALDTSAFPDTIATGVGDGIPTVYGVRYMSNISSNASAGNYGANLSYTVTASF
jgi:hypothetical protein